jgi:hypothetical protein
MLVVQVFELLYPGMSPDPDVMPNAFEVQNLLLQLEAQLADAAIGLALFLVASARPPAVGAASSRRRQGAVRAFEIEMMRQTPRGRLTPAQRSTEMQRISDAADLEARRQEWLPG